MTAVALKESQGSAPRVLRIRGSMRTMRCSNATWCFVCQVSDAASEVACDSTHAVPVYCKSMQISNHTAQEAVHFVTLRCEQKPKTLQVQRLVQRSSQKLDLRTVIENPKMMDRGGNPHAEKAVDGVRSLAAVCACMVTKLWI